MIRIAALVFILGCSTAFAQETPQVRALNMRLGNEINANLQCSTAAISLQDQLAAAQTEIKRLTEKYEPKPDK